MVRPTVRNARLSQSDLAIEHDYSRGLLCQAKIFRRNSRWGPLTKSQKKVLPEKLNYSALLLYRSADQQGDRRELQPFTWQLTRDSTVEEVSAWLASDHFPEPQGSPQLLGHLLHGRVGTDDKDLIAKDIAPPLRPSLVIKIGWKDGDAPGNRVHVQKRSTVHTRQQVLMRNRWCANDSWYQ